MTATLMTVCFRNVCVAYFILYPFCIRPTFPLSLLSRIINRLSTIIWILSSFVMFSQDCISCRHTLGIRRRLHVYSRVYRSLSPTHSVCMWTHSVWVGGRECVCACVLSFCILIRAPSDVDWWPDSTLALFILKGHRPTTPQLSFKASFIKTCSSSFKRTDSGSKTHWSCHQLGNAEVSLDGSVIGCLYTIREIISSVYHWLLVHFATACREYADLIKTGDELEPCGTAKTLKLAKYG